jgi:hypothetical protein
MRMPRFGLKRPQEAPCPCSMKWTVVALLKQCSGGERGICCWDGRPPSDGDLATPFPPRPGSAGGQLRTEVAPLLDAAAFASLMQEVGALCP